MLRTHLFAAVASLLVASTTALAQTSLGSAFMYQGQLNESGVPANGSFPMAFKLWDAASGGNQIGPTLTFDGIGGNPAAVSVANGLFDVSLDFGADAFGANARWLEATIGGTPLTPRTKVTPAPAALFSSAPWATSGSTISYTAGNIGIGRTSPTSLLHLSSNDPSGTTLRIDNPANGGNMWSLRTDGTDFGGAAAYSFHIRSEYWNLPRLSIDDAGRVGIGTTSPSRKLEVRSNIDAEIGIGSDSTNGRLWTLQSSNGEAGGQVSGSFQIIDRTEDVSRVLIDVAGRVGIGTSTPDQTLSVGGDASKPGGGSWAVYCDPRLKHDIHPMTGTLDKLLSLHGYSFEYNTDAVASGRGLPGRQIGLMADEVERVFPDWISLNDEGYRSVTERATTALMIESLRDLRQEKDAQIAVLKRENRDLAERLARLESLMEKANAK